MQRSIRRLQSFDLTLLLLDGVDKGHVQVIVLDTFDLAFVVMRDQQRLDFGDVFGTEP